MKIAGIESWKQSVRLTLPYTIAYKTIDSVDIFYLKIVTDDGRLGLGSTSPNESVTGETPDACRAALDRGRLDWLLGEDPRRHGALRRRPLSAGDLYGRRQCRRTAGRYLQVPLP